jgi:lipoprotein NlpI
MRRDTTKRGRFSPGSLYDPRMSKAHYERGRLEESLSERDAAIADFQAAASLDPNDPSPVYALFRLYKQAGEADLAATMIARFRALTVQANGVR